MGGGRERTVAYTTTLQRYRWQGRAGVLKYGTQYLEKMKQNMKKKRYVQVGTGGRAGFFYAAIAKTFYETSEITAFCDVKTMVIRANKAFIILRQRKSAAANRACKRGKYLRSQFFLHIFVIISIILYFFAFCKPVAQFYLTYGKK